jgi:chitinase
MPFGTMFASRKRQPAATARCLRDACNHLPSLIQPQLEILEQRRLFNGLPAMSIVDAWVDEGNVGSRMAAVVVSLSEPRPKQPVTVNYSTQNGTAVAGADYVASSGKLTFAVGETSKTILVPVRGDRTVETDKFFMLNLQSAKQAKIADGQAIVAIRDDEPRISVDSVYGLEGNAGTKAFTFTVSLTAPYDDTVTVNYATANSSATAGSDFGASAGTLTFLKDQPTSQPVTVWVNCDRLVESNETFLLNLSNASSNAAISSGVGAGTIIDDEPTISIDGAVNYGDYSPFVFTVSLSAPSEDVVTVDFATADGTALAGTDYDAASGTLRFNPGDTAQTITVQVIDPTLLPDKYFYVNLGGAANATILYGGVATGSWYYDYGYYDGGGWDYYYWDYYGWY